uniref:Phytocyanin domain-containing protein n=1 Tax=Leersia perrieri TaxID=77586 RepID=A0A0D9Y0L8_9ORYZ
MCQTPAATALLLLLYVVAAAATVAAGGVNVNSRYAVAAAASSWGLYGSHDAAAVLEADEAAAAISLAVGGPAKVSYNTVYPYGAAYCPTLACNTPVAAAKGNTAASSSSWLAAAPPAAN